MKKIFFGTMILLLGVILVSCSLGDDKSIDLSKEELLAVSAVSSFNELSTEALLSNNIEDNIETDHLEIVLSFIKEDSFKVESINSDLEEYEAMLNIKLLNNEFKMYYNEEVIKEELDDDELEIESSITGILVKDDYIYNINGILKTEKEEDEYEYELDIKIIKDENTYTTFKYEYEEENNELEKEFKIKVYENKKLVRSIKYDYEFEENELEIKYEIKTDIEKQFYILKLENNKGTLKYKDNNEEIMYNVDINDEGEIILEIIK